MPGLRTDARPSAPAAVCRVPGCARNATARLRFCPRCEARYASERRLAAARLLVAGQIVRAASPQLFRTLNHRAPELASRLARHLAEHAVATARLVPFSLHGLDEFLDDIRRRGSQR